MPAIPYHCSVVVHSRAKGHSATAAAAYRSGSLITDERTGEVHDFRRKQGIEHSEIVLPSTGAPEWATDRAKLWNAAELSERNKDGSDKAKACICREMKLAFPAQLDRDDRREMVQKIAREIADAHGVAVDFAMHEPDDEGDSRNYHAHVMFSTRRLNADGFGKKTRELDDRKTGSPLIEKYRESWAVICADKLNERGHTVDADRWRCGHMTKEQQAFKALEREDREYAREVSREAPTVHKGAAVTAMERKGIETEVSALNEAIKQDGIEFDNEREKRAAEIVAKPETVLEEVTRTKAVFNRRDIAKELNRYIDDLGQFQQIMAQLDTSSELVQLEPEHKGKGRTVPAKFSTREMVSTERAMIASAQTLSERTGHAVSDKVLSGVLAKHETLSDEQRRAVQNVTSANGLHVVVGDAGTGKSFAMRVAKEAWEAEGYKVIGGALAGKAAEELEAGSGIKSRTLASLEHAWTNDKKLEQIERQHKARHTAAMDRYHKEEVRYQYANDKWHNSGRNETGPSWKSGAPRPPKMPAPYKPLKIDRSAKLDSKTVLVLDEAGMVGSRQLGRILEAAEKAGAKVVMLGDDKQLAAIEAGAGFRAITERTDASEITQIRRQSEAWAKEASAEFARGDVRKALDAYNERGHVKIADTRDGAKAAIAADYLADRDKGGSSIILAHTNADVRSLNDTIRTARKEAGELGDCSEFLTGRGNREFGAGDRVVFLANDSKLGVKNGTLGIVETAKDGSLSVNLDNGRQVEFNADQYNDIDHGYAVTVHKSQGVTVDRSYVLASHSMDRSLSYVSMTRHRETAALYAGADDFGNGKEQAYEKLAQSLAKTTPKESTLDYAAGLHGFAERQDFDGRNAVQSWMDRGRETITGRAMTMTENNAGWGEPEAAADAGAGWDAGQTDSLAKFERQSRARSASERGLREATAERVTYITEREITAEPDNKRRTGISIDPEQARNEAAERDARQGDEHNLGNELGADGVPQSLEETAGIENAAAIQQHDVEHVIEASPDAGLSEEELVRQEVYAAFGIENDAAHVIEASQDAGLSEEELVRQEVYAAFGIENDAAHVIEASQDAAAVVETSRDAPVVTAEQDSPAVAALRAEIEAALARTGRDQSREI